MKQGHVFIIAGVSGSGKSTISDTLTEKYYDIVRSIAVTTRLPREGELFAAHYFFVDHKRFQWLIDTDQLLEHTTVYNDNFYGTLKLSVEQALERGHHVLFVVDTHGVEQIMTKMPHAKAVYLGAPSETEQRARLEKRGTTGSELDERVSMAKHELAWAQKKGLPIVINNVLEKTIKEVERLFDLSQ